MTLTDETGTRWTAEKRGATTYLLTRPGAMKWATETEVEAMKPPAWAEGLRKEGRFWVREVAA
jgi:hypothetical protein